MALNYFEDRKKWEATVYVQGRRIRRYFDTKKLAQEFIRDVRLQKIGLSGIQRPYRLKEAFASFLETDSAQKTKQSGEADRRLFDISLHFFETQRDKNCVAEIGLEDLQLLQLWLEKEQVAGQLKKEAWCQTTIELNCRTLKKFFRKMVMLRHINQNPAEMWKVPHGTTARRRPMTRGEYQAIYSTAPTWFRPILAFMRLTGARGASVAALRWSDVDFAAHRLMIRSRKGGLKQIKDIPLPIYPALREMLQHEAKQLEISGQPSRQSDPVFWGPRGLAVTSQEIRAEGSRLIKRCGLIGVVLYGLRHAIAVEMTEAGIPLEIIRQTMGHTNLAQTSHYASGISLNVISDALKQIRFENETPPPATNDSDAPNLDDN